MSSVVLDASALIAVMRNEAGAGKVKAELHGALISSVNLCEVFYKAIHKGATIEAAEWAVRNLPIVSVPFNDEQASIAASIHQATLKKGVSFADRACLSLGLSKGLTILTGDEKWSELDVGANVELFR